MLALLVVSIITHTKFDIFHSMLMSKLLNSWCQVSQMVCHQVLFVLLFLPDMVALFSYSEKIVVVSPLHVLNYIFSDNNDCAL